MEAFLRLGVELPALAAPVDDDRRMAAWRAAALAAGRAGGVGAVWVTGGAGGTAPTCDACTLAGALCGLLPGSARGPAGTPDPDAPPGPALGVVAPAVGGRHPAVLARDVTALDVMSGGRAALLLDAGGPGGSGGRRGAGRPRGPGEDGGTDFLWAAAEAAAVCRAVFRDAHPLFEGRYFHVAGAVNRPGPVRPGGPPVLVAVGGAPPAPLPDPPGPASVPAAVRGPLGVLLANVDALVVGGPPAQVRGWARAVQAHGAHLPLVWRGRLDGADQAASVAALAAAGVSGVLASLPASGGAPGLAEDAARRTAAALADELRGAPWPS